MNVDVEAMEPVVEPAADGAEYYEQYKALSTSAVASLVLGVVSVLALLDWFLLALPVLGIVLGVYAVRQVSERRHELSGSGLAWTGLLLSVVLLATGFGWLSYDYATEVPDGHERISYEELQPDPDKPSQLMPPSAASLDGKQVFIKGFVYPSKDLNGIREFVLCRDKGDCCFGGNPKLTDRIQVTLEGPLRLNYTPKLYRVAGVFHVAPGEAAGVTGGVIYRIRADYLQ